MAGRRKIKRKNTANKGSASLPPTKRIKRNGREARINNNENEATSILSPEEKALRNPLVVQNIMKHLFYADLQICRSMDLPYWASDAERALRQCCILNISLWSDCATMTKMFQGKTTEFEFNSISELSDHLEDVEQGYEIWLDFYNVSPRTLRTFCKKFGNVISQLELSHTNSRPLLLKLLSWLPSLSYLHLAEIPLSWKSGRKTFKNQNLYSFPQVKTISFGSNECFYPKFIGSFFAMMPNLNSVFNFPISCIPDSAKVDKFKLDKIKSVNFSSSTPGDDQNVAELSKLATVSPNIGLKKAHLCLSILKESSQNLVYQSCCESLSSILQNNQNTLESLTIEPMAFPQFLGYPKMEAVKELRLCVPEQLNHQNLKFFAENFDVRNTFPNLTEVSLKGFESLEEFLKLFPEDAFTKKYFQGVLSLDLKFKKVQLEALEKVATLFPDVTNLSINENIHWLKKGLHQISRSWPKLTSLKLSLNDNMTPILREYLLDSVLSGLSENKCADLRKQQDKMEMVAKRGQKKLGISRFTDLQDLTLVLDFAYSESRRKYGRKITPLFSYVAALYGFQRLPNLKVTCAIPWDHKNTTQIEDLLHPIKKYVVFDPYYFEPRANYDQRLL